MFKPYLIILTTFFSILLIGTVDYFIKPEFSFSLFYILPIAFLASKKNITVGYVIASSVLSTLLWFYADFTSREYSHLFYSFWNAFVRLAIFTIIGVIIFQNKIKVELLNNANSEQKKLNDEKNKFIGITSHDLRSPLGTIISFSDLLLTESKFALNANALKIVSHIEKISQNCLSMVNNLLDISKIESGKLDLKINRQDYVFFVKQLLQYNQLLASKKDILISLESTAEQMLADFDEHYLTEVLNNLLSNAIKYSHHGSRININICKKNDSILTEVIDFGKGIIDSEQLNLFKYYQKSSTQPTNGESSTGLGLAIAKHIILGHKGEIGVKSNPNKGSNFFFSFPINKSM